MNLAVAIQPSNTAELRRIRVMIVDDAVVVRGLFSRWVEAEPDLEVVASLRTGREAVNQVERADPDVVVLDVDMPELDGIAALPRLLEKRRDLIVIMASTLTRRNAEISLKTPFLGASDYIPKPDNNREVTASATCGSSRSDRAGSMRQRLKARTPGPPKTWAALAGVEQPPSLRPMPATPPRVLRPAGAQRHRQPDRPGARPGACADHAAHAADLHYDFGRALGASRKPPGARGGRRRAYHRRHHLSRPRRLPHDGRTARRRRGSRDQ